MVKILRLFLLEAAHWRHAVRKKAKMWGKNGKGLVDT